MAKCTNCNRPIPDGAKFCGHCGKTTGFEPNKPTQPPFMQYKVTPHEELVQQNAVPAPPQPNCDLSVAGFVMSLFTPFFIISFILSCVALGKKQLRRGLAIAGLVLSLIGMVLVGITIYLIFFLLPALGIDLLQYLPIPW